MISLYEYESRFQKQFGADAIEFDCPAVLLRDETIRLLQDKALIYTTSLERLHEWLGASLKKYDKEYGVNAISSLMYDTDEQFAESYLFFIKSLKEHFKFPFYFQRTPTIRIQTPDSEGSDFYPWYHNDIMLGHPPEEINIWLPLTQPFREQGHGFRRLSVSDSGKALAAFKYDAHKLRAYYSEHALFDKDCYPGEQIMMPFGRLHAFDARCLHTAEPMLHHTRVSMDVRLLPVEDYEALYKHQPMQGAGRRKIKYMPGEAYYLKHSGEL